MRVDTFYLMHPHVLNVVKTVWSARIMLTIALPAHLHYILLIQNVFLAIKDVMDVCLIRLQLVFNANFHIH